MPWQLTPRVGKILIAPLFVLGVVVGCAKVEEAAKSAAASAKEAVSQATSKESAPANPATAKTAAAEAPSAEPASARSPAPAPRVDQDRVLNEFLAMPAEEVTDEVLAQLAAMDAAHREAIIKIAVTDGNISEPSLALLGKFPNLAELSLDYTSFPSNPLIHLKGHAHLQSLSLDSCTWLTDEFLAPLLELPRLSRLNLKGTVVSDEGLKTVAKIKTLTHFSISGHPSLTGPGLAPLLELPNLQGLGVPLGDQSPDFKQGLQLLTKIKNLRELDVSHCGLTDNDLLVLRAWPRLTSLLCNFNPITDQGMLLVKPLNDLVDLDLRFTQVGDPGISLIGSRKIQRLWLANISDQGMKLLTRFPDLRELYLSQTSIGDLGIVQIKGLRHLEVLDISRTGVGDRGLSELVRMKSLKSIYLDKSNVTEEGVAAIKQAIPGLKVADRGE